METLRGIAKLWKPGGCEMVVHSAKREIKSFSWTSSAAAKTCSASTTRVFLSIPASELGLKDNCPAGISSPNNFVRCQLRKGRDGRSGALAV
jgi:hypothetical protein